MDWFTAANRQLVAPLWAWHERSPYLRHYRKLRRTQYDAPEAIADRQWLALQRLLTHAYETVPFYRQRLDQTGIHPTDIGDFNAFTKLPALTKADLRDHGSEMLSRHFLSESLLRKKTSGSTGVSVAVMVDEASTQWKRACTLRSDEWSGWRRGEPVAMIWGNPDYLSRGWRGRLRNALLDRARYLDTLKMDEAAMATFARSLVRRPVSLIFGHAHSVYLFAQFVLARGLGPIRPKGIITSAMVLHDWERREIEAAFACPVTNRYGCEEVGLIACECERHDGLHVNADSVYVEVVRSDGTPAEPGEVGAILVTDLVNRAMPLLRYQVGDTGIQATDSCPCGRGLPMLKRIEGRIADYVTTPSGDLVSGISLTENFAMLVPGIAQLQIVQEEVDRFVFRIVRGSEWDHSAEAHITALVGERFGPSVRHSCEYVTKIPQEPSGKYRFCISKVANPFNRPSPVMP
jgi:phenylacetate-CoA ligase